jgi:hypothetical protein
MTEQVLRPFPIVLWSVQQKFKVSFTTDSTGHDLFDLVISKRDVVTDTDAVAAKLISLATDYPRLRVRPRRRSLPELLGIEPEQLAAIDPRIGGDLPAAAPAHDTARYIIRALLERSGPLVDAGVLAVRLGVDRNASDWAALESRVTSARYDGVFSAGWARWWWPKVELLLRHSVATGFRALTAEQRVDALKEGWRIPRLVAPRVPNGATGTRYWHVCAATDVPLDPVDAVATELGETKAWQDRIYVSMDAAKSRRLKTRGIRLDPLENIRVADHSV